ncbi:S9 family peptidase [Microlunatus panaciterrae]|uniref:Oligopeptidase B n=1 Tax=Microlunatus panaciterrae TaxID=400768 RepID=A0ABS2RNR5_9ACTN|nr:S9 family peptidase [Microlunatus panaciterrae]MBM7800640.1 oligopeptidase B [Microlunatus panaciterrae]
MSADARTTSTPAPPVAEPRPQIRSHHGDDFVDDFEWLRDKENPEVIAYLEAENAYTESRTGHLTGLTDQIFGEIKARTKETDLTVPLYVSHGASDDTANRRGYWYYTRTVAGAEYAIHCRVVAADAKTPPDVEGAIAGEEVLLDGNIEAEGLDFFSLGAFSVSPDGHLLAYATDTTGAERFTLKVKDLRTGALLPDQIEDIAYGVAWARNSHLFYTRADDAWRPYVVLRHRLGTEVSTDVAVATEPDERFWIGVSSSRDENWIVIGAGSKLTSDFSLLSVDDPEGRPRLVAPRRQGVEYDVEPAGDRLLIVHNDGAEDFCLAEAPLDATSHEQWRTVLPHQQGVRINSVAAYASHVVVSLRRAGLSGLHVIPRGADGSLGAGSDIAFDEPIYTVDSSGGPEYETDTIRLDFGSLVTPASVYDYDLNTRTMTLLKRTPVLDDPIFGPYVPANYVERREWATAADGTRIPLSVVHRVDVPRDGSAPALIYGYGSYEIPIDPSFAVSRLSLLDRGFVFAIAHVRGGGEMGRSWYENGKMLTKRNTFTDFVACAEHLISSGYTSADRLAARGGSAGGLLMGAVANLAPATFRAIHAQVPFVDALTTILDPDLPLTVIEWEEWGDPLHDPEVYRYMKSYTPYENVRPVMYPAILATTSLNDTRVFYVEPAKWVAQLRRTALNGADRPILLKTEMVAGHGGVSGRYKSWRETAFEYAWIIDQVTSG